MTTEELGCPHHSRQRLKFSKVNDKERILKTAKGQMTITYKANPTRLSDFPTEPLEARREWNDTFKLFKD